jgi:hypothetical protein
MKTIWKWILGILIVLLVLAIPFAWHYAMNRYFGFEARADFTTWRGPMMSNRGGFGWDDGPMGCGSDRGYPHGMGGYGFSPFFGGFFFLGGLLKLAFFGALLYGAYWLGRRNARVAVDPVAPVLPPTPKRGDRVAKRK